MLNSGKPVTSNESMALPSNDREHGCAQNLTAVCVWTASRLAQVVLRLRQTKAKVVLIQTLQSLSTCCCATGASPLLPLLPPIPLLSPPFPFIICSSQPLFSPTLYSIPTFWPLPFFHNICFHGKHKLSCYCSAFVPLLTFPSFPSRQCSHPPTQYLVLQT